MESELFGQKPYKPTVHLPFLPSPDESEPIPDHIAQQLVSIDLNVSEKYSSYSDFNYKRFHEYLRWKASQKLKGENENQQQQDLVENENVVRRELSSIYGKIDENHHDYSWILKKFKSNRIQQINEILQEKDIGQAEESYLDDEKEIVFSKSEIDLFEFICKGPEYSKIEPFILPRSREAKCLSSNSPNADILFDVSQLIKKHPHGISLPQFITKYRQSYDPTGKLFTPEILQQAEKTSIVFVQGLKGHQIKILFPHSLKKYLSTPDKILTKILHMFEVLLKLEFSESSSELEHQPSASITQLINGMEDLMKDFQIRDFISDWGFTSFNQFAEILASSSTLSNSISNIQLVKAKPPSKKQLKRNIEVDEEHHFLYVPSSSVETDTKSNPQTQKSGKTQEKIQVTNSGKNSSKSQSVPVVQTQATKSANKHQKQQQQSNQQNQKKQQKYPNLTQQSQDQDQVLGLDLDQKKKSKKGRSFLAKDEDFPAL